MTSLVRDQSKYTIIPLLNPQSFKYLGHERLMRFGLDTLDWLREQSKNNTYYIIPMQFIKNLNVLSRADLTDLIKFTFKILILSRITEDIDKAFDLLYSLSPKYEEYKQEFDEFVSAFSNEENKEFKNTMASKLLKLKKSSRKIAIRMYWQEVEKLSTM